MLLQLFCYAVCDVQWRIKIMFEIDGTATYV